MEHVVDTTRAQQEFIAQAAAQQVAALGTGNLAAALAQAQSRFGVAELDKTNPHFQSKYASLASIHRTIQPHLGEAGLAVVQMPEIHDGMLYVRTKILHCSGESIESSLSAPIPSGKGNPVQLMGSTLSYLKRYSLSAMLGIATGEDDDGNGADTSTSYSSSNSRSYSSNNKSRHQSSRPQQQRRDNHGTPRPAPNHPASQSRDQHPTTVEMEAANQGEAPQVPPPSNGQHTPVPPTKPVNVDAARKRWHALCDELGIQKETRRAIMGVESHTELSNPEGAQQMADMADFLESGEGYAAYTNLKVCVSMAELKDRFTRLPAPAQKLMAHFKDHKKASFEAVS